MRLDHQLCQSGAVETTSNAIVSLSPTVNGTVPCQVIEGNSASSPARGFTRRKGGSARPNSAGGAPNCSQPSTVAAPSPVAVENGRRSGGEECVRTCSVRWGTNHIQKK